MIIMLIMIIIIIKIVSQNSSVGIATGCGLDDGDSIPDSLQTGSWATHHPISPGVKRQRREADHSPLSSAEVKNGGAIPPPPHTSSKRAA
jgi:hypothetical protein